MGVGTLVDKWGHVVKQRSFCVLKVSDGILLFHLANYSLAACRREILMYSSLHTVFKRWLFRLTNNYLPAKQPSSGRQWFTYNYLEWIIPFSSRLSRWSFIVRRLLNMIPIIIIFWLKVEYSNLAHSAREREIIFTYCIQQQVSGNWNQWLKSRSNFRMIILLAFDLKLSATNKPTTELWDSSCFPRLVKGRRVVSGVVVQKGVGLGWALFNLCIWGWGRGWEKIRERVCFFIRLHGEQRVVSKGVWRVNKIG